MIPLIAQVLSDFPDVRPDDIAVLARDCSGRTLQHHADVPFYPASVIKLCFLAAGALALESGDLRLTPNVSMAFREMIRESDNDATALVVDLLTGTTSGPELDPDSFAEFRRARDKVNDVFKARGYRNVNACQKTWTFWPYGRDRQHYETLPGEALIQPSGDKPFVNRNSLTPFEAVQLMDEIVFGKWCGEEWTRWMMDILEREPGGDVQDRDFGGSALAGDVRRWSKAGWTAEVRHDVLHARFPEGRFLTFAVFTRNHSDSPDLVRSLAQQVVRWSSER